jgi:hypothetical protein
MSQEAPIRPHAVPVASHNGDAALVHAHHFLLAGRRAADPDYIAFCHERAVAVLADRPGLLWFRLDTFGPDLVLVAEKCPPEVFIARLRAAQQKGA